MSSVLATIRANRTLLKSLVIRDLKSRYLGSIGGLLWSVVHPVVLLVSYWFVFSIVLKVPLSAGFGGISFPLYLFVGILPWLTFQDTLARSCTVLCDNANLIKKTTIPSEILPLSIALSNLVHHFIGLAVILGILAVNYHVGFAAFGVMLYLMPLLALSLGLAWIVASLNVFFRDTAQVLGIVLTFWFWFTPILYSMDAIPERFRMIASLNPLSYVVSGYRGYLLATNVPDAISLILFVAASGIVCIAGIGFFRYTKPAFADVL